MSDEKEKNDIQILSGKFTPEHWQKQMPGIDPQHQRTWHSRYRHKMPLSFQNVLFILAIKLFVVYFISLLIKTFLKELIRQNFWPILTVIAVFLFLYVLYIQTLVRNAPDLEEEMFFGGAVNLAAIVGGVLLAVL